MDSKNITLEILNVEILYILQSVKLVKDTFKVHGWTLLTVGVICPFCGNIAAALTILAIHNSFSLPQNNLKDTRADILGQARAEA